MMRSVLAACGPSLRSCGNKSVGTACMSGVSSTRTHLGGNPLVLQVCTRGEGG